MKIIYPKKFLRHLDNQPVKIQDKFLVRVALFSENKFNLILHNHALSGKYEGFRNININWRHEGSFSRFWKYCRFYLSRDT